ncbi:MAG: hypothetical protein J5476_09935 [Lachnospiraceae bacterium]|nr:hypothetical protein [Lachnospiraceae bacterium]
MIYPVPNSLRCHRLTAKLLDRFAEENPSCAFSPASSQRLYMSIYKIWERQGEAAAEKFVREARLV